MLASMAPAALSPTQHPDEYGMVLTAITMLAGVGGIAAKLGLSGDDVTTILGALGLLVTAARAIGRKWLAAKGQ